MSRRIISTGAALLATALTINAPASAQVTERVSVDSSGTEGNGSSENSSSSFDGRFVVFESFASNLVANDTNGHVDVFVHDRLTGVTERVSVSSSGAQATDGESSVALARSISDDGRYVVFFSYASNLVAGAANGWNQVFVHDRFTGVTERVSEDSSGAQGNHDSWMPSISGDGSCIAFTSYADNLVPGDSNQTYDVFVYDRATGTTEIVSVDPAGGGGNGESWDPALSRDGRFVAFQSGASNLVPGDTNGYFDVFLRDRTTGVTEMIDVDAGGVPADHGALGGSISADGRFVAFWSSSPSLLGAGVSGSQVLVRDRQSGTNTLVSVDSQGSLGNGSSKYPMLSADGRFVAFESLATNLVAGDTNGKWDVFLHDCLTGATTCCDVNASGDPSDGGSWPWSAGDQPAISGDGRFVSFDGFGDDLVPGGSNGASQVYVHGPYLTLEADPPQVAAGATLTFTTWTGAASNLALLALIDIDGVPMFLPAAFSAFDTSGVWSLSVTVPPGLSGNVLTLQTYGFVPTGKVQASNQMAVAFQ